MRYGMILEISFSKKSYLNQGRETLIRIILCVTESLKVEEE